MTFPENRVRKECKTHPFFPFHFSLKDPETVESLEVFHVTESSVIVQWTKPKEKWSFFKVHWRNGNHTKTLNTTEAKISISGLTPGTQFEVNVSAVANDGRTEGQCTSVSTYTSKYPSDALHVLFEDT